MKLTEEEIKLVLDALAFYADYLSEDEEHQSAYNEVHALEMKIERGL